MLAHNRALHGHFVYICLLCPLRSMSANALRLRLSSLAVTKVSVTYTHKKMSTANSVLVFIMCRNETCSEQSERNSERGEFTHRSERQSDGTVRTMQSIVVRKHCAQVQVSMTARQNKKARINPCSFWWCGHRDLNSDGVTIRPSNVRVCLFRHDRLTFAII